MAVVFISPKKRQKTFFLGITIAFALFLIFVSLFVFLSKPKDVSETLVFNKPKVSINMEFLDSEQFEKLEPFEEMEVQYVYEVLTKNNVLKTGFISSTSLEQAKKILGSRGLNVKSIKETESGRETPFTPYYQSIVIPNITNTTATTK
jgi:predicted tellurium resistance membrane protein TerC